MNPYTLLKINRLIRGHRLKCLAIWGADILGMRHYSVRLDPFIGCNLSCQMCHFSAEGFRQKNKGILTTADYSRIADQMFPQALQLMLGCAAEPTLHPELVRLVEIARQHNIPSIGMVTNGQRLDRESIRALRSAGLDEITISVHGVKCETYERLQPPAKHGKLHQVLQWLSDEAAEPGRPFSIRINYTVNPVNLAELEGFFAEYGAYHIDVLQLRPIMDLGSTVYHDLDLDPMRAEYDRLHAKLLAECRSRNMTLLAPPAVGAVPEAPTALSTDGALLKPLLLRYVSPAVVWDENFDWRKESYRAYCKRIGWRKKIFSAVFRKPQSAAFFEPTLPSLGYDVEG